MKIKYKKYAQVPKKSNSKIDTSNTHTQDRSTSCLDIIFIHFNHFFSRIHIIVFLQWAYTNVTTEVVVDVIVW